MPDLNHPPCEADEPESIDLADLLEASLTRKLPRGFHEQADGAIVCPHTDLHVCDYCSATTGGLVEVAGVHYWVPDPHERAALYEALDEVRS